MSSFSRWPRFHRFRLPLTRLAGPKGGTKPQGMSPKTLTGAELQLDDAPARESELFLVDGNNLAYRAFFALPEELATSEGFPTNALLGFTNMLFKLLADYKPKGVAVAWDTRPVHRAGRGGRGRLQGGPEADARPAPRAVPALPADRRGLRLPQPRVRGLGGRRRDRHARDPRRRGGRQHLRRLDRPRRVPARLRERLPDDDAARRLRRPRLHARARRGALRDQARADPRLHRAQGRHLRQHPGRPRDRRQDRRPADRPVRVARGGARARRRAVPGAPKNVIEFADQARDCEGARDHAPRPRDRLRPGGARARAARPLAAERDVPALRVPQPAEPDRRARRRRARARADRGRHRRRLARRETPLAAPKWPGSTSRSRPGDGARVRGRRGRVVLGPRPISTRRGRCSRTTRKARHGDRGHDDRRVPDRARPGRLRARRPRRRVRGRADAGPGGRGGDGRARPARRGDAPPARRFARRASASGAPSRSTARSSCR